MNNLINLGLEKPFEIIDSNFSKNVLTVGDCYNISKNSEINHPDFFKTYDYIIPISNNIKFSSVKKNKDETQSHPFNLFENDPSYLIKDQQKTRILELEAENLAQKKEILKLKEEIIQNKNNFSKVENSNTEKIKELKSKNSIQSTEITNLKLKIIQNNSKFFNIKQSDVKEIKELKSKILNLYTEIAKIKKRYAIFFLGSLILGFVIGFITFPSLLFTIYLTLTHFLNKLLP